MEVRFYQHVYTRGRHAPPPFSSSYSFSLIFFSVALRYTFPSGVPAQFLLTRIFFEGRHRFCSVTLSFSLSFFVSLRAMRCALLTHKTHRNMTSLTAKGHGTSIEDSSFVTIFR